MKNQHVHVSALSVLINAACTVLTLFGLLVWSITRSEHPDGKAAAVLLQG